MTLDATAAWWSAVEAGDLNLLRALVQAGIDPNLRDAAGESALHRVAGDLEGDPAPENVSIARLLFEFGADANAADSDHRTPLMRAAEAGSDSMMSLLLNSGADTEARDHEGRTALFHALRSEPTVSQLLNHGADIEARDNRGRAALLEAVRQSYLKGVQTLLMRGADVHSSDDGGETALHTAVRRACEQEAALQALEADAVREQPQNVTMVRLLPLVRTRADTLLDIVRLLRECGAKIDVPDREGVTPFDYAGRAGGTRLLHVLRACPGSGPD